MNIYDGLKHAVCCTWTHNEEETLGLSTTIYNRKYILFQIVSQVFEEMSRVNFPGLQVSWLLYIVYMLWPL